MCDHFKYNRITKKYDYVSRETDLLQVCTDSGELDIFEQIDIKELIEFKWQTFSYKF